MGSQMVPIGSLLHPLDSVGAWMHLAWRRCHAEELQKRSEGRDANRWFFHERCMIFDDL